MDRQDLGERLRELLTGGPHTTLQLSEMSGTPETQIAALLGRMDDVTGNTFRAVTTWSFQRRPVAGEAPPRSREPRPSPKGSHPMFTSEKEW